MVRLAREMHWPYAERRALTGGKDRGDITGIPGVVIQVKDQAEQRIATWMDDTIIQMHNDNASMCMLVVKKKFKNPKEWDAYIPLWLLLYEEPELARLFDGGQAARLNLRDAFTWLKGAGYA